jgi:hypothetical protein
LVHPFPILTPALFNDRIRNPTAHIPSVNVMFVIDPLGVETNLLAALGGDEINYLIRPSSSSRAPARPYQDSKARPIASRAGATSVFAGMRACGTAAFPPSGWPSHPFKSTVSPARRARPLIGFVVSSPHSLNVIACRFPKRWRCGDWHAKDFFAALFGNGTFPDLGYFSPDDLAAFYQPNMDAMAMLLVELVANAAASGTVDELAYNKD